MPCPAINRAFSPLPWSYFGRLRDRFHNYSGFTTEPDLQPTLKCKQLGVRQNPSRALKPDSVLIVSMFDPLITRRVPKTLDRVPIGISVSDEGGRSLWRIRVMRARR